MLVHAIFDIYLQRVQRIQIMSALEGSSDKPKFTYFRGTHLLLTLSPIRLQNVRILKATLEKALPKAPQSFLQGM
jgi:hypothetical protein